MLILCSYVVEIIYILTDKGGNHLKKHEYLLKVEKYGIRSAEFEGAQTQHISGQSISDIICEILDERFNRYNEEGDFDFACNELYYKAKFFEDEKKETDALYHYILALYYEMSGIRNCGTLVSVEDLALKPSVTRALYERREVFQDEMVDVCYERYKLPHHYLSKAAFAVLLDMIFEDENIDLCAFVGMSQFFRKP